MASPDWEGEAGRARGGAGVVVLHPSRSKKPQEGRDRNEHIIGGKLKRPTQENPRAGTEEQWEIVWHGNYRL